MSVFAEGLAADSNKLCCGPLTNLPALFANEFSGSVRMDNQRASIARLTMMALRRSLVLLELLRLLHLSRLFPLQFERLVLGGQRPECAGGLFADANERIDQGGGVALCVSQCAECERYRHADDKMFESHG